MTAHTPRLLRGELTDRVYAVTRYTEHDDGTIVADTKYDVTADFTNLAAAIERAVRDRIATELTAKAAQARSTSAAFALQQAARIATGEDT